MNNNSTIQHKNIHYGDYLESEMMGFTKEQLLAIIQGYQDDDNIMVMTDSYKHTHHLLLPSDLEYIYSYLECRGGEMPYSVFFSLQYYLKKYLAGVRVTPRKIQAAQKMNIEHFGFDCFNADMWWHIYHEHGGKLPIEIKAVPEGTKMTLKNILMSIVNTDKKCAALTNNIETLIMKLWAPITVSSYSSIIKDVVKKYALETSDNPEWVTDFLVHCFGYRGTSSEESARLLGAGHLINSKGTDTLGAITMLQRYYNCTEMPAYSVIATEHMVVCSYGPGEENERRSYETIIDRCPTHILSMVSDTNNIYNVCRKILPSLKAKILSRFNPDGTPAKLVVRPDSGKPSIVLFGYKLYPNEISGLANKPGYLNELHIDMNLWNEDCAVKYNGKYYECKFDINGPYLGKEISYDEVIGVFGILMEEFGYTVNSKGYKVLNPHIGVLQGDGINYNTVVELLERMKECKIDTTCLVFGSGGGLLQKHDRDELKMAIKAVWAKYSDGRTADLLKNPFTDPGKKSKSGLQKLIFDSTAHMHRTVKLNDPEWADHKDLLIPVFRNGEILVDYTFEEVRNNYNNSTI